MLNQDYTAKLLDLEDAIITNVEKTCEQFHISIELPRKEHTCPACGAVTDRVHDYRIQTIKGYSSRQRYLPASAQAPLPLLLWQTVL